MALVLNELATNAVKHGALSIPAGTVIFESQWNGDQFAFRWSEQGGPAIDGQPVHQGFGTRLSEIAVERQLGGIIQREWKPGGLSINLLVNQAIVELQ